MIQDDYGNLVASGKAMTLNERLIEGDKRMARIEGDLAQTRDELHALREQLGEMLEFLQAMRGALKVLNWLGKLAKPMAYIVGLVTACVSFWAALKGSR